MVIWVYHKGAYNDGTAQALWGAFDGSNDFSAQKAANDIMYVGWGGAGDTRVSVAASASNWLQNQWNCYVFTWALGVEGNLYHQGKKIATRAQASYSNSIVTLHLGNIHSYAFYNGRFGDCYMFNRLLSQREITDIASGASPFTPIPSDVYGSGAAAGSGGSSSTSGANRVPEMSLLGAG